MSVLVIEVPGIPVPQGSKNAWGGEDNPHTKGWRQTVAQAAHDQLPRDELPLNGAVLVTVMFVFPRPKSHYRTGRYADWLRDDAPSWHTQKPDLDKLQRAIGDALAGVVLRDDKQIAAWNVGKRYGRHPRAVIEVEPLLHVEQLYEMRRVGT